MDAEEELMPAFQQKLCFFQERKRLNRGRNGRIKELWLKYVKIHVQAWIAIDAETKLVGERSAAYCLRGRTPFDRVMWEKPLK